MISGGFVERSWDGLFKRGCDRLLEGWEMGLYEYLRLPKVRGVKQV